jgi:hypothetical protein
LDERGYSVGVELSLGREQFFLVIRLLFCRELHPRGVFDVRPVRSTRGSGTGVRQFNATTSQNSE